MRCALLACLIAQAGAAACVAADDGEPAPDKSDLLAGKADGLDMCAKFGFPPGCDICAEFEWYGDGHCDQDLVDAGICLHADDEDCATTGPTAFRLTTAELADPGVFVELGGCADVTDVLNNMLSDRLDQDDDGDGDLDLTLLNVFRPFDPDAASATVDVSPGTCAAPAPGSACTLDVEKKVTTSAAQKAAGTCLGPISGTTTPGAPVNTAGAPCYATDAIDLSLELGGIQLDLAAARVGGRFTSGSAIDQGLARGFISEAEADALLLPDDLPLVGGQPLSSVLPGGSGSCQTADGRDIGPDGATRGWYFYINFAAQVVDYTDP
jgi:hypothetical protein